MLTWNLSIMKKGIVNKPTIIWSVWLECNICIVTSACINSVSKSTKYNVSINVSKTLVQYDCSVSDRPINKIVFN